jgi:leader peptidase (prepilin peptidase) / N-methyltransferase
MGDIWLGAAIAGALIGAVVTPLATDRGLAQLVRVDASSNGLRLASALGGAAAATAVIMTSQRAGHWLLLPALLVWASALVAAACCDAVTQRVPTPLVRQAGVGTSVLLIVGLAMDGDWRGLVMSAIAAVASGLTLVLCWRFAGAGFGDVRLATLGGLGLGHATHRGLLVALAGFALIIGLQAAITVARGEDRRSNIPYGPALAIGFLLAATL